MWYLYITKNQDGSLYTGITENLERRFQDHKSRKGGHYTGYNPPKEILYREEFKDCYRAQEREQQIKRWSKNKKLALIQGDFEALRSLSISRDHNGK